MTYETAPTFFDLSHDMMFTCDVKGVITSANPAWRSILQREPSSVIGRPAVEFVQENSKEFFLMHLRTDGVRANASKDLSFLRPDDSQVIVRIDVRFDADREIFLVVTSRVVNLTKREQATWQLALDTADAGFWDWDVEHGTIYLSPRYFTMLGYEPYEFDPLKIDQSKAIHPDDLAQAMQNLQDFLEGRVTHYRQEYRAIRKDGSYRWILAIGSAERNAQGKATRAIGWRFDIHNRKTSEEQLRKSEMRNRTILDSFPDLTFSIDEEGRYLEVHANFSQDLAAERDLLLKGRMVDFLPKELADQFLQAVREAIREGKKAEIEYHLDLPKGRTYFEGRVTPSAPGEALIIVRDITDKRIAQMKRVESEERYRRAEERSRTLLDSLPDHIFIFDRNGVTLEVHSSHPETLPAPIDKMLGASVRDYLPPDVAEKRIRAVREAIDHGRLNTYEVEMTFTDKQHYFETRVAPSADGNSIVVVRDITEQRRAELSQRATERRMQEQQALMSASSRLAALGEMAGGIVHEINNPLTVAHAYASRLRDSAHEGKLDTRAVETAAEKIESVCMRISRIIAGLRTLARDGAEDLFIPAKVSVIVGDAVALCSEKLKHMQIELSVADVSDDLTIECRPVQISQVLVNLLSNSQHAVENAQSSRWIKIDVVESDHDVDIRVIDSGEGVALELREKIFDPFFTTKEVGRGTGLGLSVSASILRSHSGRLFLDNESPATTFVIRLPKIQAER